MQNLKIDVINSWRAIAVLAVLVMHAFSFMSFDSNDYCMDILGINICLQSILKSGWAGVDAFFIASGFVLYIPYASKQRTISNISNIKSFLIYRAARLSPLCFIGAFVTFLMFDPPPIQDFKFWKYILNFPFATFSWLEGINVFHGNAAMWSISVEFVLSLIFPFLVIMINKANIRILLIFSIIICIAHRLLLSFPSINPIPSILHNLHLSWFLMFYGDVFAISLVEFVIGMYIAEIYIQNGTLDNFFHTKSKTFLLATIGGVITVVFFKLFNTYYTGQDIHGPASSFDAFIPLLLVSGLSCLFIAILYANPLSLFRRLLTARPIQLLGLMCYSIYIWHPPIYNKFLLGGAVTHDSMVNRLLIFLLVVLFSAFSYRFIEFPNRSISEIFLIRKRTQHQKNSEGPAILGGLYSGLEIREG